MYIYVYIKYYASYIIIKQISYKLIKLTILYNNYN